MATRQITLARLALNYATSAIAEVCAFLASPAARAVTGVYLPVDCGFLTGRGVRYEPYFEAHGEAF